MWRDWETRTASAQRRLALAETLWQWTPHDRQRCFFAHPAPTRIAACGRRWGKTEALSLDVATLALDEAQAGRPCRQLIVAPTDAQARLLGDEILRRLEDVLQPGASKVGEVLSLAIRQRPGLTLLLAPPGVKSDAVSILCRSAAHDGRSLRGLWAHRIIVDEAARVPDTVLSDVLLPMLADKGGEYTLASSPAGRRSVFYRLWTRGMTGEGDTLAAFQCPSTDNPNLDQAILQAWREDMSEAAYAQEIEAQFVDDFGAVFREDEITAALKDDERVRRIGNDLVSDPAPDRVYAAGVDWGRQQDFTVACIVDATETPARLVALLRRHGGSWEGQMHAVADLLARFAPRRALADGNSLGDPLIERLRDAVASRRVSEDGPFISVEKFLFSPDSKTRLIDRLNLGLSARAVTFPNHPTLVSELRAFEYGAPGSSGKVPMAARGGGHDDCVIALALAWYACPDAAPAASPADSLLLGSQLVQGR